FLAVASGFTLGCLHAFDIDHIAAVTAFASKHPRAHRASLFGIYWGLGHTATLLVVGGLSVALKFVIPPALSIASEILVGILLIAIGLWVLLDFFRGRKIHVHKHTHDGVEHVHSHSHAHGEGHHHRHSMFFVGAAHGFAGTAAVMVLIPITITQSLSFALIYLVLFGLGTMTAMGLFAYLLGSVTQRAGSNKVIAVVQAVAGSVSLIIGVLWIGGRVFGS
ncbi:MAG: sulfite exporter TauE/SafE family protein, partial [Proteobacteria bacterium]|nr:sulfite exporter TauE/SafE family protein [Pseudomonadota bacterium]